MLAPVAVATCAVINTTINSLHSSVVGVSGHIDCLCERACCREELFLSQLYFLSVLQPLVKLL